MANGLNLRARQALLIDGTHFAHRCFHALPPLNAPDGTPTAVVRGWVSMVGRVLRELDPELGAVAFDGPDLAPWRLAKLPGYKKRDAPRPPELVSQLELLRTVAPLMGLATFMYQEADDLLGVLSDRLQAETSLDVVIFSADKDFAQLVNDRVRLLRPGNPYEVFGPAEVAAKWGVKPEQFADFLALVGDTSDKVPGVRGVGEGKAAKLLQTYPDLETIYGNLDHLTKGLRANLEAGREAAFMSRDVVVLDPDALLPTLEGGAPVPLTVRGNPLELQRFLQNLGFSGPGSDEWYSPR